MSDATLLMAQPANVGVSHPADSASAMSLVRIEGFEPVEYLVDGAREGYLRRFTTVFVDEASERRGGVGRVLRAANPRGERLALKFLVLPAGADEAAEAALRATFEEEFRAHQRLSGLRGFPRLYGRGLADGVPVVVMEWIEGLTLERAARQLAVDDAGRLSPLTAARIGRDLFDLLARMDLLKCGLAHRDISPANVMVETARLSLSDQVEEGVFELRLIDFGSSAVLDEGSTAVTGRLGEHRGATADYAPPEMLTEDVAAAEALRHSPAVDVYAAASVLYRLLEGHPPYDLSFAGRAERGHRSAYRIKTEFAFEPLCGAHGAAADIAGVLGQEPEVAVAVGQASAALESAPSGNAVRLALTSVDSQLEPLLEAALSPDQGRRPSAASLRDALDRFCRNYAGNIGCALRGEPLAPCGLDGEGGSPRRRGLGRKVARGMIGAVSAALVASVAASAGLLTDGMAVSLPAGDPWWSGPLPGAATSVVLLAPCLAGLLTRGRARWSGAGLIRAVAGSLAVGVAAAILVALGSWPAPEVRDSLFGALLMAVVAPMPLFAADYALAPPCAPRPAAKKAGEGPARRPVLPWGADPAAAEARSLVAADASALTAGAPAAHADGAPAEPEAVYEFDDPVPEEMR